MSALLRAAAPVAVDEADLERRFGGLARLYGPAGYARLRSSRIAVVGLGGVGSWAVEALARSGVAGLVLIDLDHVAESNVNRQVQALGSTLGKAKAAALAERIADIHPACEVFAIEEFVDEGNWPALLERATPPEDPRPIDLLIDACDQVRAKAVLAGWALASGTPCISVGAAGGKRQPHRVEVADLVEATHDPLLASLRQRLRKAGVVPRGRGASGRWGVRCVFSREPVAMPIDAACAVDGNAVTNEASGVEANLACHGYGSAVTVTATFGMVAAAEAIAMRVAEPGGASR